MRYIYEPGAVRWFRWHNQGDVRGHRPPAGWSAFAHFIDRHPVTGAPLARSEWWMQETKE